MLYSYVRACQILRNVEKMGLRVTSCEDDTLLLRRCLAASFFLKRAMKQPDGEYRYGVETVYELYPLSAELNDDMKEKNVTL
ncbi:hypothetical protein H5410_025065 [Solanum commersonii]|uniref:Uncharacterized protein n=1 Tax=Solanum commersonii TaxID=4109 RepID=A0A9J5YUQ4_SOLCO|nr:hypothetical protein H5410_025065 [Solanum commersonii]